MKYIAIIPARYASKRFPGKPLALLNNKYIIRHVYEKAIAALGEAYIATDDERIAEAVKSFNGNVVMTSTAHRSGTDRIAEAADKIASDADVIINIQGDEPFISKNQIQTVCRCFEDPATQIATLGKPFGSAMELIQNPNSPKIVLDNNNFALYFSRSVIPYQRDCCQTQWADNFCYLKHIGIYAFNVNVLREVTKLPPSTLELAENLEQLRWLQNGYKIKVGITDEETIGIDTPEDLRNAEKYLNNGK